MSTLLGGHGRGCCCILVPLYTTNWKIEEIRSLARCLTILSRFHFVFAYKSSYDIDLVLAPWRPLVDRLSSWSILPLDDGLLSSVASYNLLMLCADLYRNLVSWDYVLVYQLDAWILSGNLEEWLESDFTYVGAPWCPHLGSDSCGISGVGNGGLSLRKVPEMISILSSKRSRSSPVLGLRELISSDPYVQRFLFRTQVLNPFRSAKALFRLLGLFILYPFAYRNSLDWYSRTGLGEDVLLSLYAPRVYPWMRIPSVSIAARFSLETNPLEVAKAVGVDVPFGCHAWEKNKEYFANMYPSCF
jgi:hypothetical protein